MPSDDAKHRNEHTAIKKRKETYKTYIKTVHQTEEFKKGYIAFISLSNIIQMQQS